MCYLLQRRMDRSGTFYLVEKWRSAADLRKHLASPHLTTAMARKDELFAVLADGRETWIFVLPGVFSLNPRSVDEQIAYDVLTGNRGDTPKPAFRASS